MRATCRSEPCSRKVVSEQCLNLDIASKARSYKKTGRPHGGLLQGVCQAQGEDYQQKDRDDVANQEQQGGNQSADAC